MKTSPVPVWETWKKMATYITDRIFIVATYNKNNLINPQFISLLLVTPSLPLCCCQSQVNYYLAGNPQFVIMLLLIPCVLIC